MGYSIIFNYDGNGNVISQTNALNQTTNFTYQDDSNKLSGFKDARGNDVLYSYDNRGNLSQITYEDGTTDKYVYNADGLLTKSVNRRGQEIAYDYNNNYQITKETYSDGEIVEYEYGTTSGLLTSISDNNREDRTQFNYSQAENKFSIIHPSGLVHSYIFDNLGRKTQIAIQDGTNTRTTNYSYDSLGRLDKLTDGSGNLIVDYDYHPVSGQLVKETNGNGTYTSYSYDFAGQLISLVNAQADDTVNSRFDYTYDNLGRRTEVSTLDGIWSYEYDLTGQLTGAVFASINPDIESQNLTYVYDAAGNRTQTIVNGVTENYSTNNLNQYQITKETQSDGSIITYEYSATDRLLTSVSDNSSGSSTQFNFNQAENKISIEYANASIRNLRLYSFDELGRKTQISVQDTENTYTYSYDLDLSLIHI